MEKRLQKKLISILALYSDIRISLSKQASNSTRPSGETRAPLLDLSMKMPLVKLRAVVSVCSRKPHSTYLPCGTVRRKKLVSWVTVSQNIIL